MFVATFIDKKISMKNGQYNSPLFGAYIIISESMVPHINVYDAVVTLRVDANDIKVDDIITFISKEIETAGTPITHRVIGIVYEDENKDKIVGFRTKGDHNNTADFALIAPNEVIGRVFLRIPMIGYLQTIMTKPIGWLLIVVIPCLLIIGSDILKLVKTSKLKEDESPPSEENIIELKNDGSLNSISDSEIHQNNVDNQISKVEYPHLKDTSVINSLEDGFNSINITQNIDAQTPQNTMLNSNLSQSNVSVQDNQNFESNTLNPTIIANTENATEKSVDNDNKSDQNNLI